MAKNITETVAQNIFLGREKMISKIFIDDKKMEKEAERLLKYVGVYIKPDEKISNLTVGKQQMVEIAKAISFDSKILVLDEPTAALTEPETEELFRIMNELKLKGIGMIYISHRMDEIERISDRVTVMRDGEYVGTVNTLKTTKEKIVKMMVGRAVLGEEKEILEKTNEELENAYVRDSMTGLYNRWYWNKVFEEVRWSEEEVITVWN